MLKKFLKNLYEKRSPLLFIIPLLIFIICLFTISNIKLGVDFTGGFSIVVYDEIPKNVVEQIKNFKQINFKELNNGQYYVIEGPNKLKNKIIDILSKNNIKNYKVDEFGSSLGSEFFKSFISVLIISFILMSLVVFLNFKEIIPSIAVIQAAIFDGLCALCGMALLGIPLNMYSFAAILMLIGYSVDTDILLNYRVLKTKGKEIIEKILSAYNTGILLTTSSLIVAITMYIVSTYIGMLQLSQISSVLVCGLFGDIISTWFTNAGILIYYFKRGEKNE